MLVGGDSDVLAEEGVLSSQPAAVHACTLMVY